jgi:hypothetical protein
VIVDGAQRVADGWRAVERAAAAEAPQGGASQRVSSNNQ